MSETPELPDQAPAEERALVSALGDAAQDHDGPLSTDEIDEALGLGESDTAAN